MPFNRLSNNTPDYYWVMADNSLCKWDNESHALEDAQACLNEGYKEIMIFEGDEDEAFTHFDPVYIIKKKE